MSAAAASAASAAASAAAIEPDESALDRELSGAIDRVVSAEALLALSARLAAAGDEEGDEPGEDEIDEEEEEEEEQQKQEQEALGDEGASAREQEGGGDRRGGSSWREKRSNATKARQRKDGKRPAKRAKKRHMTLSQKVYLLAQMERLNVGVGRGSKTAGISFEHFCTMMVNPPRAELGYRTTLSHRSCRVLQKKRNAVIKAAFEHGKDAAKHVHIHYNVMDQTLEDALHVWFLDKRKRDISVSDAMLLEAAAKINALLHPEQQQQQQQPWQPSMGFLTGWKKRHRVTLEKKHGESLSAETEAAIDYQRRFVGRYITEQGYRPSLIYNADETGLYYRQLPDRTLISKVEEKKAKGHKQCKRRLTALTTCNATGTHKPKLFVIGTVDNPRCFRGGIKATLPVVWKANKTAWMNTSFFYDWVARHFVPETRAFKRAQGIPENEKVLLLVDNFSGHKLDPAKHHLPDWLTIEFLPENTTSLIQPCDGGIIAKFKRVYRKALLRRLLCEAATDSTLTTDAFVKRVNVLHAVQLMQKAWDAVTEEDVAKVWQHTLLRPTTTTSSTSSSSRTSSSAAAAAAAAGVGPKDDAAAIRAEVETAQARGLGLSAESVDEWLTLDDDMHLAADAEMTYQEAVDEVTGGSAADELGEEGEEDDPEPQISYMDAARAARVLYHFFAQKAVEYGTIKTVDLLSEEIEALRIQNSTKQTTMWDFFARK